MAICGKKYTERASALPARVAPAVGLLPAAASAKGGETAGMSPAASALGAVRDIL